MRVQHVSMNGSWHSGGFGMTPLNPRSLYRASRCAYPMRICVAKWMQSISIHHLWMNVKDEPMDQLFRRALVHSGIARGWDNYFVCGQPQYDLYSDTKYPCNRTINLFRLTHAQCSGYAFLCACAIMICSKFQVEATPFQTLEDLDGHEWVKASCWGISWDIYSVMIRSQIHRVRYHSWWPGWCIALLLVFRTWLSIKE